MLSDGLLDGGVVGLGTGLGQLREPGVHLAPGHSGEEPLALLLGQAADAPVRIVDCCVAPLLPGFLLVRVLDEPVEHLFCWHAHTFFQAGHGPVDRTDEPVQTLPLLDELTPVTPEDADPVVLHAAGQHRGDVFQAQPELLEQEDLLQARELRVAVPPAPTFRGGGGRQKADRVVVPQRPRRHPGQADDLVYGPDHHQLLPWPSGESSAR